MHLSILLYFNLHVILGVNAATQQEQGSSTATNSKTMAVIPGTPAQTLTNPYPPPPECKSACGNPYQRSFNCGLGKDAIANKVSIPSTTSNAKCVCNAERFMQDAPACIECLFDNPEKDVSYRSALLTILDTCVDSYHVIPCPDDCAHITSIVSYCDGVDEINGARTAGSTSIGSYAAPPPGIPEADTKSFPCICQQGYKEMVDRCYNCVKRWDINRALWWREIIKKCTPPKPKKQPKPTEKARATISVGRNALGASEEPTVTNGPGVFPQREPDKVLDGGNDAPAVSACLLFSWLVGAFVAALVLI